MFQCLKNRIGFVHFDDLTLGSPSFSLLCDVAVVATVSISFSLLLEDEREKNNFFMDRKNVETFLPLYFSVLVVIHTHSHNRERG